jgi:hypothetical protein
MRWEVVDWIYLAQDRDKCHVAVNTVTNLRLKYVARNFVTS